MAAPDTPYPVGRPHANAGNRVARRVCRAGPAQYRRPDEPLGGPNFPTPGETVRQVLAHRRGRALPLRSGPLRGPHHGGAELQPQAVPGQRRRLDPRAPGHGRFGARTGPRHATTPRRASCSMHPGSSRYEACPRPCGRAVSGGPESSRNPERLPHARSQCGRRPRVHRARPGAIRPRPWTMRCCSERETLNVAWSQANFTGIAAPDRTRMVRPELPGRAPDLAVQLRARRLLRVDPQDAGPPPHADHAGQQRRPHHGRESRSGGRDRFPVREDLPAAVCLARC